MIALLPCSPLENVCSCHSDLVVEEGFVTLFHAHLDSVLSFVVLPD